MSALEVPPQPELGLAQTDGLGSFGLSREIFDQSVLADGGIARLAERFSSAKPFPHLIIEGLFNNALLRRIAEEFDEVEPRGWTSYESPKECKRGTRAGWALPPATQAYFDAIYSGPFVRYLQRISGLEDLITDPLLHGGGMHEIPPGGRFDVHIDFQKHPRTRLDNRLVLITYLNDNWKLQHGGQLELWDPDRDRCVASVVPTFGRTLLFMSTTRSPHGHPHPVCEPNGRPRRSVLAYYYVNEDRSAGGPADITTLFIRRPRLSLSENAKWTAKRFTPPILLDAWRRIQRGKDDLRQTATHRSKRACRSVQNCTGESSEQDE